MHVNYRSLIFAMKKKLVNNYIVEIEIKNTRTRCEICSTITRKTHIFFYCWLWTCICLMGFYLHFYWLNNFHYLNHFHCLHDLQKNRGESHIDFRTQCVIMTLACGGLSLIMFWNYCSCITIFFSYDYLILDGKDHLSIKKVVKNLRN